MVGNFFKLVFLIQAFIFMAIGGSDGFYVLSALVFMTVVVLINSIFSKDILYSLIYIVVTTINVVFISGVYNPPQKLQDNDLVYSILSNITYISYTLTFFFVMVRFIINYRSIK